ncbi:hypothetical protein PRZ48_001836 [Zasmidium cellare]|uniref:ER transporter 6TM N-terminal domain-containing protein n=1 Tax=Zasmidium cellare TaxID=395010 RepID=A0ABR0F3P7_ZASCE|nr:hypothetical protein PRZ48_001836 [Zasmidium cellare]
MADTDKGLEAEEKSRTAEGPNGTTNGTMKGNSKTTYKSAQQPQSETKKPSKIKALWQKAGLDVPTVLMMFKGSLPPTLAICMYQSRDVQEVYQTLGYLVAITSVLGMCIMPRGMFMQNMFLNTVAVCIGASVNLLALYCATQARLHTATPGERPNAYNSSASAVLAVWLIFQTYLANSLRAALPQFQFPVIIYSIMMIVSLTYGTQFPNMTYAISFMERLLESFLTGFALATGVSLFVIPLSSRKVVFKEWQGYLGLLGGMLATQAAYLRGLEDLDPEAILKKRMEDEQNPKKHHGKAKKEPFMLETPEALKLKGMLEKVFALHTKLPGDINFAKREVGIGKLGGKDLSQIWSKMRMIMIPISGLNTVIDVLIRRAQHGGWGRQDLSEHEVKTRNKQIENLHELMKALHGPFASMSGSINGAFKHILITLEIEKPPKKKADEESQSGAAQPGTPGFAEYFKQELDAFFDSKKQSLLDWCKTHGIELPQDFMDNSFVNTDPIPFDQEHLQERTQRQLFFALYVEYLLWRAGHATLELVLHVDKRKAEGALKSTRLIVPGMKTLRKWLRAMFCKEDQQDEDQYTQDLDHGGVDSLYLGDSYGQQKDPEHLPPQNFGEKIGEVIRLLPRALRSDASAFGFRVCLATMSIGIICYLQASQQWFLTNRLLWGLIMIPLSMTKTAGQSTWSFALRILGTALAMIGSYIIWYIVDGKTAGVIVFLWLWIFLSFYVVMKFPKLIIVGILTLVTAILIIGYELQVKAIGVTASESNGQPAYPTYQLAPYRLATVCGGLFVAYFWTIFPYPVSESTLLRKDIGAALYLLANLYSVVHETVKSRVQKIDGDSSVKGTRGYHLEKARLQVFTKLVSLLTTLQQNSAFSRMQLRVGGRFPREEYDGLLESIRRVLQYTSLVSYASATFSTHNDNDSEWAHDFRMLLASVKATSHQVTSLLALLSNSMAHARPLPPYLEIPKPAKYMKTMTRIDKDILSVRHMAEPEYSAFAVITICAMCVNEEIEKIARHVKTLVGEIDFSFHVVSTSDDTSDESSVDSLTMKEKESDD